MALKIYMKFNLRMEYQKCSSWNGHTNNMDSELNTILSFETLSSLITPFHFPKHFPNLISHFNFRKWFKNEVSHLINEWGGGGGGIHLRVTNFTSQNVLKIKYPPLLLVGAFSPTRYPISIFKVFLN